MRDINISTTIAGDNIEAKLLTVSSFILIFNRIYILKLFLKNVNDDTDDLNLFQNFIEKPTVCLFKTKFFFSKIFSLLEWSR